MKFDNLSLNGLFFSIDVIKNTFEENQTIFAYINKTIKKKIKKYYYDYLKTKEKKDMLKRYRRYLSDLTDIIDSQIDQIDSLLGDDNDINADFEDLYSKMKTDLFNNCFYLFDLDIIDTDKAMDNNERKIYYYNYWYHFINNYFTNFKEKKNQYFEITKKDNDILHKFQADYFFAITLKNNIYKDNAILLTHKNELLISNNSPNIYSEGINDQLADLELTKEYYISQFQANLSKVVYYQRNKMNLTQKKLAELSHVDRTMIAKIEKVNQKTTMETAIKLLTTLNLGIMIYPLK